MNSDEWVDQKNILKNGGSQENKVCLYIRSAAVAWALRSATCCHMSIRPAEAGQKSHVAPDQIEQGRVDALACLPWSDYGGAHPGSRLAHHFGALTLLFLHDRQAKE